MRVRGRKRTREGKERVARAFLDRNIDEVTESGFSEHEDAETLGGVDSMLEKGEWEWPEPEPEWELEATATGETEKEAEEADDEADAGITDESGAVVVDEEFFK